MFFFFNTIQKASLNWKSKIKHILFALGTKDVLVRIETLLKQNEISGSPKFIKQSSFSHIFGFKITNISIFYGK